MPPAWLGSIEETRQGGNVGVLLTFNVDDRTAVEAGGTYLRLPEALARYFSGRGYAVVTYSLSGGATELHPPEVTDGGSGLSGVPRSREPEQALPALGRLLRRSDPPVVVVIEYADHLAPDTGGMGVGGPEHVFAVETLHRWATDPAVRATDNLVVLVSRTNATHGLLRSWSGYRTVRVDLPDRDERRRFVTRMLDRGGGQFGALQPDLSVDRLAEVTGGLRLVDLEAVFRRAAVTGRPVDRAVLSATKSEVIRELGQDRVEVCEPDHGFDEVAGLDHVRSYFDLCLRAERVPQGVLLAGVPGTGKSFVVQALASELGYPLLSMRNVRERWVGASERNLEQVLWIAESLAPCVMWLDEVDQLIGQRSGGGSADGGTSERLLARLWEFLGETGRDRGILWCATTNRPDLLDPALLDRLPVVIPFLHPTPGDVVGLLPILAAQQGRHLANQVDLAGLAAMPALHLPTVRGLQEVVATAGMLADAQAGRAGVALTEQALKAAAADYLPNHDRVLHELIALVAISMTSFRFLLPWQAGGSPAELPAYLHGVVDGDGELDAEALQARIRERSAALGLGGMPG